MAEVCQSFVLDCGAFTLWRQGGGRVDVPAYAEWVRKWDRHPGFDWCLIPDVIDGSEFDNDQMIASWFSAGMRHGVPVWHLHESMERLEYLIRAYPRVALGSSGSWARIGTADWWRRMDEVREVACDADGRPKTKLHGLRMLSPDVVSRIPFSSADSCNVAVNIGKDQRWKGTYAPVTPSMRALVIAERIECNAAATTWQRFHAAQEAITFTGGALE